MEDVHQLRVFHAAAQYLSFTRAANSLFLTQSAVSHQIAALERSLDARLFIREGKRVTLSQAGRVLEEYARRVFALLEEAEASVRLAARPDAGTLRIGASPAACEYLVPESLREFRESYPGFGVSIVVDDSPQLARKLGEGSIDLAIMIRTDRDPHLTLHELFSDELGFIVSSQHAWARTGRVEPREIAQQQFVLYTRTSATFRLIERYLTRLQIPLRTFTELGSMGAIREIVKLGLGVTIAAPWIAYNDLRQGALRWLKMPRHPLRRTWCLATRAGRRLSIAEQTFLGLCRATAQNLQLVTAEALHAPPGSGL